MAGALVSTVSDVLKYRYLGPLQTQLNNEILVTQILDLNSKNIDLDGLKAVLPLHYGRSGGIGARREDETLPTAGNQKYKSVQFDLAYLYGRARFTGQAIQKTKTDAGAFIRVMTDELDRLRDDLALDTARQYYGSTVGIPGAIAKVASVAGSVVTLTSDEALQKGFLHIGMLVDAGVSGTASSGHAAATPITDVDVVAKTITLTTVGTTATNDYIFRASANDASGTKEIDAGLNVLISGAANTVGGLDASAAGNKYWDNIRDTSGGAISLDNLMLNVNKAQAAGAKADQMVVLTTPGLARRLFATGPFAGTAANPGGNVRFVNTTDLKAGFSSLSFSVGGPPVSVVTDRLAPYGSVFMVDKRFIQVFSPGEWDFLSRDGLTIRWDTDKDAFQAALWRYVNLGTRRRNTSLVMNGLTDTGF
jgi:hypothetical protein